MLYFNGFLEQIQIIKKGNFGTSLNDACLEANKIANMADENVNIDLSDLENNHQEIGDAHEGFSIDTPLREDAFEKSDDEKIALIQEHMRGIMETLGLDLTDDSLIGTPKRVAKKRLLAG